MTGGKHVQAARISAAAVLLGLTSAASAFGQSGKEKKDARAGSEFIDPPEWQLKEREAARRLAESKKAKEPVVDEKQEAGNVPGYQRKIGVGLAPSAPQGLAAMPTTLTRPFGSADVGDEYRFEFHGYLQAGLRASIGERTDALGGQGTTTLHGDPIVPGTSFGWFDHTFTVPVPWAQLNFSYGNDVVKATAILAAWSFSQSDEAAGYFNPPAQLGFNDAFLTYTPDVDPVGLEVNVGVYPERYGAMGKYDQGVYGASLIGSVFGMGTTTTVTLPFEGDLTIAVEGGFKGDLNKPSIGLIPDSSNEFARPEEGSTYVAHGHVSAQYAGRVTATAHYITTWSQDDRSDPEDSPATPQNEARLHKDGAMSIIGADLRVEGGRFGYLYAGGAHVDARDTRTISNTVMVLNAGSGKELMERYWGFESGGTGTLTLLGGQYSLSLGTLLRHPVEFFGDAPDLTLTAFGIYGDVTSEASQFNRSMLKYGAEATYSMTSWFAVSGRFDHVRPNLDNAERDFMIFSPRLIFRTGWQTREALFLQYAGYVTGDDVVVQGDNRLLNNPSGRPDQHLVAIYGTMWW